MLPDSSSILINSPIEKVYKTAETYPTFVKFYKIKDIIESTDSKIVVNVGYGIFGFLFCWTGIGEKTKYNSIIYTQTKGLLKGMEAHWSFVPFGEKTKVNINTKIKKSFPLLNYFIKKRIKKITDGILFDLKDTVEKEKT